MAGGQRRTRLGDNVKPIEIDTRGLESDLAQSPALITAALLEAGLKAREVLGPAILARTPEISGDLKRSESLVQDDPFLVSFEAGMIYASNVEAIRHYMEHGVADARPIVEAIYNRTIDELTQTFGSGT